MRTLGITLASLLLVAGCATTEAGEPTADDESTQPTEQTVEPPETTQSSSTSEVPHRPKDIDLASVDICTAMKKVPVRKYGLDGRAPISGTSSVFPGNKDCFFGGIDNNLALNFIAVTDQGAGEFAETANAKVSEFDAQGYPLYVLKPDQPANCFGMLDVHDGQFVWIAYSVSSTTDRPVTSQDKLCKTVPTIAASAVSVLE